MENTQATVTHQVITACAFIHKNTEGTDYVLLPKRADSKQFMPGKHEVPGGHIELGEDIRDGLKRELHEELGVSVELGDPFYVFTYINNDKKAHYIEVVYFAQLAVESEPVSLKADDHSEVGWFSESETVDLFDDKEDEEVKAIAKGFALLAGKQA